MSYFVTASIKMTKLLYFVTSLDHNSYKLPCFATAPIKANIGYPSLTLLGLKRKYRLPYFAAVRIIGCIDYPFLTLLGLKRGI